MGQKVNPIGLRLGIINTWDSVWYASKDYALNLHQDLTVRKYIMKSLKYAGISQVRIERAAKRMRVFIKASRPGMVISKKSDGIDKVKNDLIKIVGHEVSINLVEERRPEINSVLVAQSVAQQLEKRIAFRKASKRAVQSAMRMGAKGIRINVAGRLGGAEIARTEWYREGRVPLHTLRADIDYGTAEANTTYGIIGVKVWIYKGNK